MEQNKKLTLEDVAKALNNLDIVCKVEKDINFPSKECLKFAWKKILESEVFLNRAQESHAFFVFSGKFDNNIREAFNLRGYPFTLGVPVFDRDYVEGAVGKEFDAKAMATITKEVIKNTAFDCNLCLKFD